MSAQALQTQNEAASVYHQHLEDLALELQAAMQAITSNSVGRLEESIAKQEFLCCTLTSLAKTLVENIGSSEQPLRSSLDNEANEKIRNANRTIHDLNLQYASLLKHSGRSIALLSSLCKSHTGQFPEVSRTMVKHQTWSCEM